MVEHMKHFKSTYETRFSGRNKMNYQVVLFCIGSGGCRYIVINA